MRALRLWLVLAFWMLSGSVAVAQPSLPGLGRLPIRTAAPTPTPEPARAAPDSPRASFQRFHDLCERGRWSEAARFLDLPPNQAGEAARRTRELSEVIAQELGWDILGLSGEANGDPDDGLPARVDLIGEIPNGRGGLDPLRMQRREATDGARWVFVRASVQRIETWYGHLEGRWAREHLPAWLNARGPRDILWWQWAALPVFALVALALGRIAGGLVGRVIGRLARQTLLVWDPQLVRRAVGPVTLLVAALLLHLAVPNLSLYRDAEAFVESVLKALLFASLFWALWRTAELLGRAVGDSQWARDHAGSVTLIPLGVKLGRVIIVAIAVVAVLSALGYPVASLLAGLGIGGLALALAAQKTGEHLFGTVAIGLDQPFRVGDWVKVDGEEGTVEAVGLRSTRLRTLDRTVISIPNGKLADMKTETFSARDRFRVNATLPLEMNTSPDCVRKVIEGIREVALAHEKIHEETLWVFFKKVGESSFEIEVSAWFQTTVYEEWLAIRGEMLLKWIEVVESSGAKLAYPTRTVKVNRDATAAEIDDAAAAAVVVKEPSLKRPL